MSSRLGRAVPFVLIGLRTGTSAGFGHCGLVRRLSIKEQTDAIGDGHFDTC